MTLAADIRQGTTEQSGRPRFVLVPLEAAMDADLTDGAFRTYCVLRRYCFGRRNYCWPSVRSLAADRHCSEETIRRHLRELSDGGLLRVAKRGRSNLYLFPEQPRPLVTPHIPTPPSTPMPHTDEGQRLRRKKNLETSPPDDASVSSEPLQDPTTAWLTAKGVSTGTARRLVRQYGREICDQALALLDHYQASGSCIRNPGGWLYSAITRGFVKPAPASHTPPPEPQRGPAVLEPPPEAHADDLKRRRRAALARRGITEDVEALWERVCGRLRDEEDWTPVLTAACLRPMGERDYAVLGPAGALAAKLRALLPAITAALQLETGRADCRATVPAG